MFSSRAVLLQRHGFFRTEFLATETGNTNFRIHHRNIFFQGECCDRAMIDTDTTRRAVFWVSPRAYISPGFYEFLDHFVIGNSLTTQGGKFEIR